LRFADAGLHAVARDFFGRTADTGRRGDDFPFREHVEKMETERVAQAAAVGWQRILAFVDRWRG
jgi:carboxymethylenebutenolidase